MIGNHVNLQGFRGFESRPLRQTQPFGLGFVVSGVRRLRASSCGLVDEERIPPCAQIVLIRVDGSQGSVTRSKAKWAIMAATAALGAVAYSTAARGSDAGTAALGCPAQGTLVVVDTGTLSMLLCENGKPAGTFAVRIGKNGTGKSREGDGKTPLGRYGLGEPRASATYGTFVPVAYPTPEQRKLGFTGSAIGVHGPDRRVDRPGVLDATEGCVGVATKDEIKAVSTWIRMQGVTEIVIH